MNTLTALAIVLIALAVIGLAIWALRLKKMSAELTERANTLADKAEALKNAGDSLVADQKALVERYKEIQPFLGKDAYRIAAAFVVTDDVTAKYKSDASVSNVARNRLAVTIGNEIVRAIAPTTTEIGGKPAFEYKVKVVSEK